MSNSRRAVLLCLAVAGALRASPAGAACNTIPVMRDLYPSTMGSVPQRLLKAGGEVKIVRTTCDGGVPFDANLASNVITLTFIPDLAASSSNTTTMPAVPLDVQGCVAGSCAVLRFTMPATNPAGPVRVTVDVAGKPAAEIGRLFEPTSGCDRVRERVFEYLTALPQPNDVVQVQNGTEVRLTLDGGGNILIPLDHRKAREMTTDPTLAVFEYGYGSFCARKPAVFDPFCWFTPDIDSELADAPRARDLLQAFTLDGHRVLPLLDRDDDGRLFGVADSPFSVLRIKRNSSGPPRYDVRHRLKDGKGPVVLSSQYEVAVCHEAKVQGLRSTPGVVVHARAGDGVHVHDYARAGRTCGKDTGMTAAEVALSSTVKEPTIEAGNKIAAFVRTDLTIRAFNETGSQRTPAQSDDASLDRAVNDYPLAVTGEHVWFRSKAGTLETFDPQTKAFKSIAAASDVAVAGKTSVARALGTSDAWTYQIGGAMAPLGVAASRLANDGTFFAVAEMQGNGLVVWAWPAATGKTPQPPSGPDRPGLTADGLAVSRGCSDTECRTRFVVTTIDGSDRVLRFYDAVNKQTEDSKRAAADVVTGARAVAFRVPEDAAHGGGDLNKDTDLEDRVMHVALFDDTLAGPIRYLNTGFAALGQEGPWDKLGWRTPYVVTNDEVLFLVRESDQRTDLNQDGVIDEAIALVLFEFRKPSAQTVMTVDTSRVQPFLVVDTPSQGSTLLGGTNHLAIGDADGDGSRDPFDSCAIAPNPQQIDDDYDLLGDGACDQVKCTDYTPPAVLPARLPFGRSIGAATGPALAYLETRASVETKCLDRLAVEGVAPRAANANTYCRGTFVASVENRPSGVGAAGQGALDERERTLLAVLEVRAHGGAAEPRAARDVVRAYGEAVNASTRAAVGRVRRGPSFAGVQRDLAAAVTDNLIRQVAAMQACLVRKTRSSRDLGAECFGRLAGGKLALPTDGATAGAIRDANQALETVVRGIALAGLRTCASRTGETGCFVCTNWRNAVRATLSLVAAGEVQANDLAVTHAPVAPPG